MASAKEKKENEVDMFWSFINGKNEEQKNDKNGTQSKQSDTRQTEEKKGQSQPQLLQTEGAAHTENQDQPEIAKNSRTSEEFKLEEVMQRLDELEAFDVKDESNEDSEMEIFFEKGQKETTLEDDSRGPVNLNLKAVQKKIQDKREEPPVEENLELQQNAQQTGDEVEEKKEYYGVDYLFSCVLGDYMEPVTKSLCFVASGFGIFTILFLYRAIAIFKRITETAN